jgi:hypothetical protein
MLTGKLPSLPTNLSEEGQQIVSAITEHFESLNRPGVLDITDAQVHSDAYDIGGSVSVERYGARGDGTNDTTAIQNALSSGAKRVVLKRNTTYTLNQAGTLTISATAQRYCLKIPDGVTLDLNGSTLKLGSAQNAALIINSTAGTTQNSDITVCNGWLDGNETNQTTPATGDMPCIFLYDVLRPRVYDLKVKDARQYAGRFLKCERAIFRDLDCKGSDGDGWSFGVSGTSNQDRSFIGDIYADDCRGTYGATLQGNPVLITAYYTAVGRIVGNNCAGGIKIQGPTHDVTVDSLIFLGGANGTNNSGIKLQGQTGLKDVVRVTVGNIVAKDCYSEGLYIFETVDCAIGQYTGDGNASNAASALRDFFADESNRLSIGQIHSSDANNGAVGLSVSIGSNCLDYVFGSIQVNNANGVAVQVGSSGYGTINSVVANDDQGTPTMTQSFKVSTTTAKGRCGLVKDNLAPSTVVGLRALISGINLNYEIGRIINGSTDPLEGVATLTNAGTSTTIACGHIAKQFVGTSVTDHYFHPVIQVIPWNATAMALEASGGFRTTVVRDITGTGFDIKHAAAGATDYVFWKVLGWKVAQREQA